LIILSQLDSLLGFRHHVAPLQIIWHLDNVQPFTLLVGAVTSLAMWHVGKLSKKIPPAIMGLAAGSVTYYIVKSLGFGGGLGPVIGAVPSGVPSPTYLLGFASLTSTPTLWPVLPSLITGALSLAIV